MTDAAHPQDATDARIAAMVAEEAGRLLLEVRAGGGGPKALGDPKALGQEGDRRSNELILRRLAELRPGDAVLSEEAVDNKARLGADRVWIVDPLDGSREYGLPPRSDWAVHVALWERGRGLAAGAVALPALGHVWATDDRVADDRVTEDVGGRARPLILVSDSRPPAFAEPVAEAVGADVAPMGSAGAKAMAVRSGDADAYLHAGGQWEWDSAAPVAVLAVAGFHTSRIDGSPLVYNEPHPYLPDLLVCRPDLAGPLLKALGELAG